MRNSILSKSSGLLLSSYNRTEPFQWCFGSFSSKNLSESHDYRNIRVPHAESCHTKKIFKIGLL